MDNTNPAEDDSELCPVLLKINIIDKKQYFYLNTKELSAFPEEDEVLLQDGLLYEVKSIDNED